MKKFIKKLPMWFTIIIVAYLLVGLLFHHFIFPIQVPDFDSYFKPGYSFPSQLEGLTQTVSKIEDGKLHTTIQLQPHSKGPVAHVHENFEEIFTVHSGTLLMQYENEVKKMTAGQTIVIPKNTPHKPMNESDSVVSFSCEMPLEFAFCLSQVYSFWDERMEHTHPSRTLLQLSVYGSHFDSYPTADAPPKPVLKMLKFLLAPTARLMGFKYYHPAYSPKKNLSQTGDFK